MSSDDMTSLFAPLDDLIQIIYQGALRFVVLSAVGEVKWTIHVGLTGPEGRWWSGRWTEKDMFQTVGSKYSSRLLETFAKHLADKFIQGELHIGNWSPQKGADINLTIGPNEKTPIHVPLTELCAEEGASFATKVLTDIARHSQSRKCQLCPPSYEPPAPQPARSAHTSSPNARASSSSNTHASSSKLTVSQAEAEIRELKAELAEARRNRSPTASPSGAKTRKRPHSPAAAEEISNLKAELAKMVSKEAKPDPSTAKLASVAKGARPPAAVAPRKGASLANPSKKRRKYHALEFGSDED